MSAAGGTGELERGRAAFRRRAWTDAYGALSAAARSSSLAGEDLELLAVAAYLRGLGDETLQALHRAHRAYADGGVPRRAARCVFWMGLILMLSGDLAQAGGWLARARRLLQGEQQECAEHGLLMLPATLQALEAGDYAAAQASAARAAELGERVGDADLLALPLHWQGRALLSAGRVPDAMTLLDGAIVAVVAGEVWPPVGGSIYCEPRRRAASGRAAGGGGVAGPDAQRVGRRGHRRCRGPARPPARPRLARQPDLGSPGVPGPFAFADGDRLTRLLESGGFRDVSLETVTRPQRIGDDIDDAVGFVMSLPETHQLTVGAPPGAVAGLLDALREAFTPYAGAQGVVLDSSAWLVTAHAG